MRNKRDVYGFNLNVKDIQINDKSLLIYNLWQIIYCKYF